MMDIFLHVRLRLVGFTPSIECVCKRIYVRIDEAVTTVSS